jgi:hypothetical protein
MPNTFETGETVVVKGTTKDEDDVLVTPAVSTKITILDSAGTAVVDGQDVTFSAEGVWYYRYAPSASQVVGAHHARVKAIDVASPERSTISDSEFFVVD